MKKNFNKAIILMLICSLLASFAQIFYKFGALRLEWTIFSLITNWPLILGVACYGVALIFMLLAYRYGELTVLYPILATTYIWVMLLAAVFFADEIITYTNVIGVLFIVAGITSIGVGSK